MGGDTSDSLMAMFCGSEAGAEPLLAPAVTGGCARADVGAAGFWSVRVDCEVERENALLIGARWVSLSSAVRQNAFHNVESEHGERSFAVKILHHC